jgi:hypothetical protein
LCKIFTLGALVHSRLLCALVHIGVALSGQGTAGIGNPIDIRASVHGTLKRISFPAKHVVSVMPIASRVALREDEGLGAIGGPHVVEWTSIPGSLEKDHGDPDWVSRGTSATHEDNSHRLIYAALHKCDVALVVGAVEVPSIPAGREEDVGTNTAVTLLLGQLNGVVVSTARG